MTAVIRTEALTKRYGRTTAVSDVALEVVEGQRYGLLGPNGAGKTTLVRMLLGLVYPTSGRIELLGRAVPGRLADVLPHVGALVEAPAGYPHLSGRANLRLLDAAGPRRAGGARRDRRRRVEEALERVGLAGIDRRPLKAYSLGMRQRLGLAAALLRSPRLLVLDEPTNGLDPRGIQEIRELLTELNAAGTTVFLSSHLLPEVEQLCSHVGIMDGGRLVVQDALSALRGPTGRVVVRTADVDAATALLDGRVEGRVDAGPDGGSDAAHEARFDGVSGRGAVDLLVRHDDPSALNAQLVGAGVRVVSLTAQRRTLEDVVLDSTGGSADRIDR